MTAPYATSMKGLVSLMMLFALSPVLVSTIRSTGKLRKGSPSFVPGNSQMLAGVPILHGTTFLIISSPPNGKIVYTQVANGVSLGGEAAPLIDSGLTEPRGLAIDTKYGNLYVADTGAQKIFRYGMVVDGDRLETNGLRTTVVTNATVDSVAVDLEGNLFYTAGSTNNINKLSHKVIQHLADGEIEVSTLEIVSAKKMMGEATGEAASQLETPVSDMLADGPTDAPGAEMEPYIYSMYEAEINPYVTEPGAIQVDGPALFWTNKKNGSKSGTVVQGEVNPRPPLTGNVSVLEPFPAVALTTISEVAYGMVKASSSFFWTTNETEEDSGIVYGQPLRGGQPMKYVEGLSAPKGLVWDGDLTVYVADDGTGIVQSFPIGRQMQNAPLSKAIEVESAYGLALLRSDMPGFQKSVVDGNSGAHAPRSMATLLTAVIMVITRMSIVL